MAYILLPVVDLLDIPDHWSKALSIIASAAVKTSTPGVYRASMSIRDLAVLMNVGESTARRCTDGLRLETTYLQRGEHRSEWLITLPSRRAINDMLQCRYEARGLTPNPARLLSEKGIEGHAAPKNSEVSAGAKPLKTERFQGGANRSVLQQKALKTERFQNRSNKDLQGTGCSTSSAGPISAPEDFEQLSGDAAERWLAGKGLRSATQQGPAPNDETGAAPPAGDLSGMIG